MGRGAGDIAAVVPEVRAVLPALPPPPTVDPEHARFRFFEAVSGGLRRAGGVRPVVLVLDDLHGADTPSLLLLQYLARELRRARLLVVAAYRDVGLGPDSGPEQQLAAGVTHERIVQGGEALVHRAAARADQGSGLIRGTVGAGPQAPGGGRAAPGVPRAARRRALSRRA
jgi:hypothetical protein